MVNTLTFRGALLFVCWATMQSGAQIETSAIPKEVPPRRSTQLADGFGVNLPLPRDPRLPWTEHWWTRLSDSGAKWVRLGQYENSSEKTGWDWVEQTPGAYHVPPEVDEAIRSLVENGISIEVQLCYNNALYQGDRRNRPTHVAPAPDGIGQDDKPPNPIFKGIETEDEIQGFLNYTRFMVNRYKGKVRAWEFWNEPNIGYWQPDAKSREQLVAKGKRYGKALCRFADTVHETDPESKVIFGGTSSIDTDFVVAAIADCPSKIDVMAYHSYPGYGSNHAPEEANGLLDMDSFREAVLRFPGIRRDIEFWENEWNVAPSWENSNESVQARYLARFYLENKAHATRGFVWEFIPGTDGNEGDAFGLMHGQTNGADAFQPREAYRSFEVTSALFADTERDRSCETVQDRNPSVPQAYSHGQLTQYCFRDRHSGKPIYAVWLAVYAAPEDRFVPIPADISISDPRIQNPILVDVRTGEVMPAAWQDKKDRTVRVELKDSVIAVADATYLDWREAPEAPGELVARRSNRQVNLEWKRYGDVDGFEVQRSADGGSWEKIANLKRDQLMYSEALPAGNHISYRVRALGQNEPSAWSNPTWIDRAK